MVWVFAIMLVLALGGVAVVAAGKGAPMAPAYDDRPDTTAPRTGRLAGDDLRRVRFPLALRGYRMSEVDALLDRVARQLDELDGRSGLDGLDAEAPAPPADPPSPGLRGGAPAD